jgi:hypothetical protein
MKISLERRIATEQKLTGFNKNKTKTNKEVSINSSLCDTKKLRVAIKEEKNVMVSQNNGD